jgi:hypothetical protein
MSQSFHSIQFPGEIDMIWPVWNLFDFTPEGRGKDWYSEA